MIFDATPLKNKKHISKVNLASNSNIVIRFSFTKIHITSCCMINSYILISILEFMMVFPLKQSLIYHRNLNNINFNNIFYIIYNNPKCFFVESSIFTLDFTER